jgi:catecholate siderophore receptor
MTRGRNRWWLLLIGALAASLPLPAQDSSRRFDFRLPAQPLVASLQEFSELTEIAALGQTAVIGQTSAPAVQARLTAAQALDLLLANSNLRYRFIGANTVAIDIRPSPVTHPPAPVISRRLEDSEIIKLEDFEVIGRPTPVGNYGHNRSAIGTKTDTALINVPQALTVVTRDLIDDQAMAGMADVVRYIPGVGIAQGEGNRDAAVLRGSTSSASFYTDGLRDDVDYYRDLYNVERIEALKGPNAMIFGRGGPGGLINRVTKQAGWAPVREVKWQGGAWNERRGTADLGWVAGEAVALRLNALVENSGSYRRGVTVEREGVAPSVVIAPKPQTTLRFGGEYFHDARVNDRGIPSFKGRPLSTDAGTFFGDPQWNHSDMAVGSAYVVVEHVLGNGLTVRSAVGAASYEKYYQNILPSTVTADGRFVNLIAYSSETNRDHLFNQTDVTGVVETGSVTHELLAGVEFGRQWTENFRQRGFFGGPDSTVDSIAVPVSNPTISVPVVLRQRPVDVTNHGVGTTAAIYVQDQASWSPHWLAVAGLRLERLQVDFTNDRTRENLSSSDTFFSPRLGLIWKPVESVSIYGSYTLSYLPRAGEKLSSLTLNNRSLEPELFENHEVGAKWDILPDFSVSLAGYQLDRRRVEAVDPVDASRSVLVDGQQVRGGEVGLSGKPTRRWSLMAGYAYQEGKIKSTQSATIQAGAWLPHLPRHTFSLWNRYDFSDSWGVALGIIYRDAIFASTDNAVTLPGFTHVDAAVFYRFGKRLRTQINVENVLDRDYYSMAYSNNNITPGSPLAWQWSVTVGF